MWGYWQLSLRLLFLGVVIPFSVGFTLTLAGYYLSRNTSDLEEHGDVVRARVREKRVEANGLWVRFEYVDETGALHNGSQVLRGAIASAVQTSGFIEIRYDRRRPEIYDIATGGSQSMESSVRTGILVGGVVLMLTAVGILLFRAVQIARIYRLLRTGQAISSSVRTHVQEAKDRPANQFTYAYQGPNGRWYEGVSPVLPPSYLTKLPVGKSIRIVFDPRLVRRSEVDLFGVRSER